MEAESIKAQYFRQQVEKGIRDIFEAQKLIATERIYQSGHDRIRQKRGGSILEGRSGVLLEALTNPRYRINPDGEGIRAETTLPTYIRFLDMKRNGNYKIYNRQIWGILYKETLINTKYEFRDWLAKHFPELLEQFNKQSKY